MSYGGYDSYSTCSNASYGSGAVGQRTGNGLLSFSREYGIDEKALELMKKIRDCKPYLRGRLKQIEDTNQLRMLEDDVEMIQFWLELSQEVRADCVYGVETLEVAYQEIVNMSRKFPIEEVYGNDSNEGENGQGKDSMINPADPRTQKSREKALTVTQNAEETAKEILPNPLFNASKPAEDFGDSWTWDAALEQRHVSQSQTQQFAPQMQVMNMGRGRGRNVHATIPAVVSPSRTANPDSISRSALAASPSAPRLNNVSPLCQENWHVRFEDRDSSQHTPDTPAEQSGSNNPYMTNLPPMSNFAPRFAQAAAYIPLSRRSNSFSGDHSGPFQQQKNYQTEFEITPDMVKERAVRHFSRQQFHRYFKPSSNNKNSRPRNNFAPNRSHFKKNPFVGQRRMRSESPEKPKETSGNETQVDESNSPSDENPGRTSPTCEQPDSSTQNVTSSMDTRPAVLPKVLASKKTKTPRQVVDNYKAMKSKQVLLDKLKKVRKAAAEIPQPAVGLSTIQQLKKALNIQGCYKLGTKDKNAFEELPENVNNNDDETSKKSTPKKADKSDSNTPAAPGLKKVKTPTNGNSAKKVVTPSKNKSDVGNILEKSPVQKKTPTFGRKKPVPKQPKIKLPFKKISPKRTSSREVARKNPVIYYSSTDESELVEETVEELPREEPAIELASGTTPNNDSGNDEESETSASEDEGELGQQLKTLQDVLVYIGLAPESAAQWLALERRGVIEVVLKHIAEVEEKLSTAPEIDRREHEYYLKILKKIVANDNTPIPTIAKEGFGAGIPCNGEGDNDIRAGRKRKMDSGTVASKEMTSSEKIPTVTERSSSPVKKKGRQTNRSKWYHTPGEFLRQASASTQALLVAPLPVHAGFTKIKVETDYFTQQVKIEPITHEFSS